MVAFIPDATSTLTFADSGLAVATWVPPAL